MTPREKILALLEGTPLAPPPVLPMATFSTAHLAGIPVREARHDAELMARCLLEALEKCGYDGIYAGWESSFNLVAAALGCGLSDPPDDVPSVDRPLLSGDPPDPDLVDPGRVDRDPGVALHAEVARIIQEKVGRTHLVFAYVPGPFTLAGLLLGSDRLLLETAQDPDLVKGIVDKAGEACFRFARSRAEAGADVLVVADPLASSSVISPPMFRRFAKAPLSSLLGAIAGELGKIPSLHICGRTTPILRDMAETGTRILELDHAVDMKRAASEVPEGIVLQGNLDPALLLSGPVEKIREAALQAVEACEGRPFILSTGCEVGLRTPLEHYRALVNVARSGT